MNIVESEKSLLFAFIEGVTGNTHNVDFRSDVILDTVQRLIEKTGSVSLLQYLDLLGQDSYALSQFINGTTIHTTRWFREANHLDALDQQLSTLFSDRGMLEGKSVYFKAASFGCSSGQEVYSIALILERYRLNNKWFNYDVTGYDVDIDSIERAKRAIYPASELSNIPEEYMPMVWEGEGATHGLFTLDKEVRKRCFFKCENILDEKLSQCASIYDVVFIRNVLIYFTQENSTNAIVTATKTLKEDGSLYLGHSEAHLVPDYLPLKAKSASIFNKKMIAANEQKLKKILIVEDSRTVLAVLEDLMKHAGFDVDCVHSKESLDEYIRTQSDPDIISLDLHMPRFNGEEWLKKYRLRNRHTPVVVISSRFSEDASPVLNMLSNGAIDYVEKKQLFSDADAVVRRFKALTKVSHTEGHPDQALDISAAEMRPRVILIGASTGGIKALKEVLQGLPATLAPVVIVQHISPEFAEELAMCLERITGLKNDCTENATLLKPGSFYIATGDFHITVKSEKSGVHVVPAHEPEHQFRPSVDVLFSSVDKELSKDTVSILLSGMGRDGVRGMGKLFKNGAMTIAQNEESAAVFGMPGEAIKSGYAGYISTPVEIRKFLHRTALA